MLVLDFLICILRLSYCTLHYAQTSEHLNIMNFSSSCTHVITSHMTIVACG